MSRPIIKVPDPFHFVNAVARILNVTFLPQKVPRLAVFPMPRISQIKLM